MKQQLSSIPEKTDVCETELYSPTESLKSETNSTESSLDYLSNLKSFLTALVILHHTAVFYGGAGHLPHHSPSHPPGSEPILLAINAINQTFFMALFFFIAGFFSRRTLARRTKYHGMDGVGEFVKERIRRLGVPVVFYSLFGPAMCRAVVDLTSDGRMKVDGLLPEIQGTRGVRGPIWFCALLLIFDGLLAATWKFQPRSLFLGGATSEEGKDDSTRPSSIRGSTLLAALSLLTTTDFFWRFSLPVGRMFITLNLNLGYLPQYIAAYTFGVLMLTPSFAIPSKRSLSALMVVSLASSVLMGRSMTLILDGPRDKFLGGRNTGAAVYAVWNNSTGYLIGATLLLYFQRHVNGSWKRISSLTYSAFFVHIPVSLLICTLLEDWSLGPVIKTFIMGLMNIVGSWVVAWACHVGFPKFRHREGVLQPARSQATANSVQRSRRRTLSKGEKALEILEGLDEVGC